MSFLCLRTILKHRSKHKDKPAPKEYALSLPGRMTGSDSVDTLANISLSKQAGFGSFRTERVIIQDFAPCVDDELSVSKSEKVTVLYRENDWVYATTDDGREGFVPLSFCAKPGDVIQTQPETKSPQSSLMDGLLQSQFVNKDKPPGHLEEYVTAASLCGEDGGYGEVTIFSRCDSGQYVVLFDFTPRQENDLAVKRGEIVTLLNYIDPEWSWVLRGDAREGFIPAIYACPLDRNSHEMILVEQASYSAAIAAEKANLQDTSGHVFYTGNKPDMRNTSHLTNNNRSPSYFDRTAKFGTATTDFNQSIRSKSVSTSTYEVCALPQRQRETHDHVTLTMGFPGSYHGPSFTSSCHSTDNSSPRSTII